MKSYGYFSLYRFLFILFQSSFLWLIFGLFSTFWTYIVRSILFPELYCENLMDSLWDLVLLVGIFYHLDYRYNFWNFFILSWHMMKECIFSGSFTSYIILSFYFYWWREMNIINSIFYTGFRFYNLDYYFLSSYFLVIILLPSGTHYFIFWS